MANAKADAWLCAALLLTAAAPAQAQRFEPRNEYEELTQRPKPVPAISGEFAEVVRAPSADRLVVTGLAGNAIELDISWYEPREFLMLAGDRYLGFAYTGYEAFGFMLVDRAMSGEDAAIDTGAYPMLSPDGRWFAAAEMSESGYGNLNGIALWEVLEDRTVRRFFTDALPYGWGWRIDGWASPACVSASSIAPELQPETQGKWDELWETAPRQHYSLTVTGEGIDLRATYDQAACGEHNGTQ